MRDDPIVAKIRKIRDAYAAQFNYDLKAMYQDLRRQEKESGPTCVSHPSKPAKPRTAPPDRPPEP
jgi:hypothetical protein